MSKKGSKSVHQGKEGGHRYAGKEPYKDHPEPKASKDYPMHSGHSK